MFCLKKKDPYSKTAIFYIFRDMWVSKKQSDGASLSLVVKTKKTFSDIKQDLKLDFLKSGTHYKCYILFLNLFPSSGSLMFFCTI